MRCGAFVDRNRIPQYTEQDYNLPENPPFSWLLRKPKSEAENKTDDEKLSKSQNDENASPNNNNNLSSRIAEASKLSQSPKDNLSGTSPSSLKSRWSVRENKEDDKLLKELVSLELPCVMRPIFTDVPLIPFSELPICVWNTHRRSREILSRLLSCPTTGVVHSPRDRSYFRSNRDRDADWRSDNDARRVRNVA